MTSTLIVLAKECVPGRVKTRLHPPLTLEQAAELAAASLADTMAAAREVRVDRRLLWFDGAPPPHAGFAVGHQPPGGLDERIAAALEACRGRTLLIGMDTPQVDPAVLQSVFDAPADRAGAWFGPAADGGFWALGLDRPHGDLVRGVPMSTSTTGAVQRERLTDVGLTVHDLPVLTDVDTVESAEEVAATAPATRFAAAFTAARERSVA